MSPRTDAIDYAANYQTNIDWQTLATLNLNCHINKATEGVNYQTPGGNTYMQFMRAYHLKRRIGYHFIRRDSKTIYQIDNLSRWWTKLGGMQDGEASMIDWEPPKGQPAATADQVISFLNIHEQRYGPNRCMVYSADWVPEFTIWRQYHPEVPLMYTNMWIAARDGTNKDSRIEPTHYDPAIWQWGIRYDLPVQPRVDVNEIWNLPQLDALCNHLPLPPTVEDQTDTTRSHPHNLGVNPGMMMYYAAPAPAEGQPKWWPDTYLPCDLVFFDSGLVRRAVNSDNDYRTAHNIETRQITSREQYNALLADHGIGYTPCPAP